MPLKVFGKVFETDSLRVVGALKLGLFFGALKLDFGGCEGGFEGAKPSGELNQALGSLPTLLKPHDFESYLESYLEC